MQNTTPDLFSFQLDTPAPVALVQPLPAKSAKPVATCAKVAHFVTLNRVAEAPSQKMLDPRDAAGFWGAHIATRPDYDPNPTKNMNTPENISLASRTNTRDGVCYVLQFNNGIAACPHCGTPMMLLGDSYENSFCACWWKGANQINYFAQVVVAATAEGEQAYLDRQAEYAREQAEQRAEAARESEQRRAAMSGRRAMTRLQFVADDFGNRKPKYLPDAVEVTIEKCYSKDFGPFNGGYVDLVDVMYPDGSKFYIRVSQIQRFL